MSDGTNTKSWQKFMAELNKEGMDFLDIQHADERTRMQLLEAMPSLSPIDRASVTTTWRRLAEKGSTTNSSTPSRDPAPVPRNQSQPQQQPQRTSPRAGSSGRMARQDSSFGPTVQSSAFDPVQDYVPPRLEKGSRGGKVQPPVLNVPVMNMGVSGQDVSSLLRTALDRGDCGTALPLASEMLQTDPIGLIHMLHEYLPQLSVEQLKTILGIGVPMGQEGGGSPTSPQQYSPRGNTPRGGGASPPRQGSMTPRGGNSGGNGRSFRSNNNEGSPGIEMSVQPTLNGQPLSAGQVLTAHSMQAQYGARFTATCNGRSLIFPYCVQRGDRIVVRSAQERLL
jgi:hypothetical protein